MSEQLVRSILAVAAQGCWSSLDVGCGDGKYRAPTQLWHTLDAHYRVVTSHSHKRGNLLDLLPTYGGAAVDLVYALDVIEHLEKPDGILMLEHMERIARHRVLIFTPNGYRPQPPEPNNPWQEHKSGWLPGDFRARGYQTALVDFDYTGKVEPLAALWAVWEASN